MENLEIFKSVLGFKDYEVSNLGRIKSLKFNKEKILKPSITPDGYCYLNLLRNNKLFTFRVHRLVIIAFIPNIESKQTVNHINGIKTDNKVENLEWATRKEQTQHAIKTGLFKCPPSKRVINMETNIIYNSPKEVSMLFNINLSTLRSKLNGNRKNNTNYEFIRISYTNKD